MEALKVTTAILAALILLVAVYVSGAILGWIIVVLTVLAVLVMVVIFIAYMIYDGLGTWRRSRENRKSK